MPALTTVGPSPWQPILPSHWACCRFWAIACPTACACSSRRSPSPTTSSLSPPSPSSTVRAPIRFGWAPPRLWPARSCGSTRRSITALPRIRYWVCCCGSACSRAAYTPRLPASSWLLPSRPSAASSSIALPIGWASACRCSMTATMTRHTSWASMTLPSRPLRSSASCTASPRRSSAWSV